MFRVIQGISLRKPLLTDPLPPCERLKRYASPSVQLCSQRSFALWTYANLAVNCYSFAACHVSIMRWSDFSTRILLRTWHYRLNVCPSSAYRSCICENMRRVSTMMVPEMYRSQVWHFMRLSVFRFHSP